MVLETPDTYFFNGQALKRRVIASVSDSDAMQLASRNPGRYHVPNSDGSRPNMFKARDDIMKERMRKCHSTDAWVRDIMRQWCAMSGLAPAEADFWREVGFMEAVRNGRDIQIRRYLDDDGWAWVVIRDIPSHWLHRRRLPEAVRQKMVAAAAKKNSFRSRY